MFGAFKSISSRLLMGNSVIRSEQTKSESRSFTLFSSLPLELRRRIWHFALPERLIEAVLDIDQNGDWVCWRTKSTGEKDLRCLPLLFQVCVESREFCFEQFVPFANTFIHPTLDLLYISWAPIEVLHGQPIPKFTPIHHQPLSKLHTVAMTIGRNGKFEIHSGRFGALVSCLANLGVPKELQLTSVGGKSPSLYSNVSGFSITNGQQVMLLKWPNNSEVEVPITVRSSVLSALVEQQEKTPGFKVPELSKTLIQIYSGPL